MKLKKIAGFEYVERYVITKLTKINNLFVLIQVTHYVVIAKVVSLKRVTTKYFWFAAIRQIKWGYIRSVCSGFSFVIRLQRSNFCAFPTIVFR